MEDVQHAVPSSGDIDRLLNKGSGRRRGIGVPSKWGVFGPLSEMHAGALKSSMRPSTRAGSDVRRTGTAATTNRTINLPARSFSFRQRRGKLDTRAIAQIDLNRVVRETDIDTIQNQLENLAFSDITLQDFNQYSDEYFLKLFQIAQLTVEYLLNVQESLVVHAEELESQCDQIQHDCAALAEENESVDAELRLLKQEIKQKQNTISTYELMLLTRQHQAVPPPSSHGTLAPPVGASGPVECILCNKKFLSTEYLLKHQRNKHVGAATEAQAAKPATALQVETKEPPMAAVEPEPRPPPTPDLTVVNALISANTAVLTKQIEAIHVQLAHDKSERAKETQLLVQQHQSMAEKMVDHMARMQDALKDMHVQSQAQRQEWTHFAHDLMQKTAEKAKTAPHIGPMVSDGAEEQWRREILQELKAQKEEEKQRRMELEAERKRWNEREAELQAKLHDQPQLPTLTQLVAMEAHRYGIDYGLTSPRAAQEDRPTMRSSQIIQTDRDVRDSQQQTDDVPEKPVAPQVAPQQAPPPPVEPKKVVQPVEAKPATPVVEEIPKAVAPVVIERPSPVLPQPAPPIPVPVQESSPATVEPAPPRLDLHRAATSVQRVAAGFITRKHLNTPENWVLRYGTDVEIEIAPHMTANALRRTLAEKLGGIDPHRVLVHHTPTGSELVGDVLVFYTNGNLEIEVVPDHDPRLDDLVDTFHARTSQIQRLRHASPRDAPPSAADVVGSVVKLQALVRGVLGRRRATELRIDRLVDLRLKELHEPPSTDVGAAAILHSPRDTSPRLQQEAVRVQARLVQAMADFHGRPPPQKSMSQDAFDAAMKNVDEARKKYPAPVQSRIATMLDAVHAAAMQHYDPAQAKVLEDKTDAAVSIQSMVRVGLAKKLVAQLAKKSKEKKERGAEDVEDVALDSRADAKVTLSEAQDDKDVRDDLKAVDMDDEKATTRGDDDDDDELGDDEAMTIDEFNQDTLELVEASPAPARATADERKRHEYDDEKAQLRALQDIQDDDDAKSSRISPHSDTPLKSMHRRNSRGSMLHNAR